MKNGIHNADAVVIEHHHCARLDITYKLINSMGDEYSDSETFSCPFPGKDGLTKEQAVAIVQESARQWAQYKRFEGFETSAFDSVGNCY